MVGWPGRRSPRLRWTRGLALNSEMTEEEERWEVLVWMKKLCDVQGFAHWDQYRQPCRGPQVAERFVEALEEGLVEIGQVVSTEGLFVRKVCLQCAPQTRECEAWDGCRNPAGSDRSELAGDSGDGTEAKEQAWVVQALDDVFLRHGEHASSDVAISPDQWVVGPFGFVSVLSSCRIAISCASPRTHLSEEGPDPFEGSGSVQLHKNTCRKKRWVRQAVVRKSQNNEFSMKEGSWTIK